jgi:hypothetical protein
LHMSVLISGVRSFINEDQMAFSRLSGDFNPLHVDDLIARRGLAGCCVVHGIHLLFWALDTWCATLKEHMTLISLDVEFLKPVPVGVDVHLLGNANEAGANLALHVGDLLVTTIVFRARQGANAYKFKSATPPHLASKVLDGRAISTAKGKLPLMMDLPLVFELAPSLVSVLPAHQIAFMLATTRLVGMECPGLHSLYSELHFTESEGVVRGEEHLEYRVNRFDQRFSIATILIAAPLITGSIAAFLRPEPKSQPACYEVRAAIDTVTLSLQSFSGQRALIIGGSRGLGEVFAKVLALCGAEVLLTYHQGEQDSKAIVADIRANNGKADCLQFDVESNNFSRLVAFAPTVLYYMATPFIGKGQRGRFNSSTFARYGNFYVNGFAAVFAGVRHEGLGAVYFPSSVFLDEMPVDMSEYIAAKSAGETLCATLAKTYPAIRFSCPRLPRIATDQSASLVPTSNKLVLPLVLAQLENFVKGMK